MKWHWPSAHNCSFLALSFVWPNFVGLLSHLGVCDSTCLWPEEVEHTPHQLLPKTSRPQQGAFPVRAHWSLSPGWPTSPSANFCLFLLIHFFFFLVKAFSCLILRYGHVHEIGTHSLLQLPSFWIVTPNLSLDWFLIWQYKSYFYSSWHKSISTPSGPCFVHLADAIGSRFKFLFEHYLRF